MLRKLPRLLITHGSGRSRNQTQCVISNPGLLNQRSTCLRWQAVINMTCCVCLRSASRKFRWGIRGASTVLGFGDNINSFKIYFIIYYTLQTMLDGISYNARCVVLSPFMDEQTEALRIEKSCLPLFRFRC